MTCLSRWSVTHTWPRKSSLTTATLRASRWPHTVHWAPPTGPGQWASRCHCALSAEIIWQDGLTSCDFSPAGLNLKTPPCWRSPPLKLSLRSTKNHPRRYKAPHKTVAGCGPACRRVSHHVIIPPGASALPRPEERDCNPKVSHTSAYPGEHPGEWRKSCWRVFCTWAVALGLCLFLRRCLTLSWLRMRWRPSWASTGAGESVPCSGEIRTSCLSCPPSSSSCSTNFYNDEKMISCLLCWLTGASTTRTIRSTPSSKRQTPVCAAASCCVVRVAAVALLRSYDTECCSHSTKALFSVVCGGVGHQGQLASHVALITFMILIQCTYSKHWIIFCLEKLVLGQCCSRLFL